MLLSWSGLLEHLHTALGPLMAFLSLPPAAALPLLVGIFLGIYAALAVMVILPFTVSQMTLIAVFLLIAHSLIQEGIIQAKAGMSAIKMTMFRLTAAILAVVGTALFLPSTELATNVAVANLPYDNPPFFIMFQEWLRATFLLALKMFIIIIFCLALLEIMKKIGFIHLAIKPFIPLIRIMGLSKKAGFIWMTAVMFGLVYGAAIILEAAGEEGFSKEELEALHLSIGVNHAIVEDPILFMSLGINPFWIYVPRLLAAVAVVRVAQLLYLLRRTISRRRVDSQSGRL